MFRGVWKDCSAFATDTFTLRDTFGASLDHVTARSVTPWGRATVVAEVKVAQRAGDKRFASVVQLLEDGRGDRLVRFAYSTGGVARRGPVTLRMRDLEQLQTALADHPPLAAIVSFETREVDA